MFTTILQGIYYVRSSITLILQRRKLKQRLSNTLRVTDCKLLSWDSKQAIWLQSWGSPNLAPSTFLPSPPIFWMPPSSTHILLLFSCVSSSALATLHLEIMVPELLLIFPLFSGRPFSYLHLSRIFKAQFKCSR